MTDSLDRPPRRFPLRWVLGIAAASGVLVALLNVRGLQRTVFRAGGRLVVGIGRRAGTVGVVFAIAVVVIWCAILVATAFGPRARDADVTDGTDSSD